MTPRATAPDGVHRARWRNRPLSRRRSIIRRANQSWRGGLGWVLQDADRWLGVGWPKVERARRRRVGIDRRPEPRHPGDIRRGLRIKRDRRRRIGRPTVRKQLRGVPDQMWRTVTEGPERFRDRSNARPLQRAAIAADDLEIQLIMARIDRGDHRVLRILAYDRSGIGGQSGNSNHGPLRRKSDSARG